MDRHTMTANTALAQCHTVNKCSASADHS